MSLKIITKSHAADSEIEFLAESMSKSNGSITAMPTAWELILRIFILKNVLSIPLAQYPARNTIWKLIHTCIPQYFPEPFLPAELVIPEDKRRPFPWKAFYGIMLCR